MVFNDGKIGPFAQKMYDYIDGLHTGEVEDTFGFIDVAGQY
jgi:branched-chain amino acid aminotransferase